MLLAEQVKVSRGSPLVTCLLEGPSGRYVWCYFFFICFSSLVHLIVICLILLVADSGKTAMAASVGIGSDFPYVKIVSGFSLFSCLNTSFICFTPSHVFKPTSLSMYRFQLNQ